MSQKRASEDLTTEHAAKHRTIASSEPSSRIRALEFFSGIGGLHYGLEHALKNTSTAPEVLAAFDINQIANSVYEHNFASKPSTKTIAVLTPKDIERYGHVDLWLLSPPCQPFTSGGKALDDKDDRSKPLLHLLDLLPKLASPPKYLFLENVPNFETSVCRNLVVTCLQKLGYEYQEYIVSPLQFGIPNDRRRYYLAAKRTRTPVDTDGTEPNLTLDLKTEWPLDGSALTVPPLSEYLEDLTDTSPYLLPANYISSRPSFRFDIVRPESLRTSTVTKSYGTKMVTRSGSFLQTQKMEVVTPNFDDSASIIELGLRFLTPVEVARLHAFPIDAKESSPSSHKLEFPKSVSMGQQWKLLGNSLNVKVIGELMKHSFFSEQNERK